MCLCRINVFLFLSEWNSDILCPMAFTLEITVKRCDYVLVGHRFFFSVYNAHASNAGRNV